jgi:hypothetical protein
MNTKHVLIATAIAALAPIAAQAESPFAGVNLATEAKSTLTRAEVREEVFALDRSGQNFGQAFPYEVKDPMTMRLLAEVRREARNAQRMYGEISGERGHN